MYFLSETYKEEIYSAILAAVMLLGYLFVPNIIVAELYDEEPSSTSNPKIRYYCVNKRECVEDTESAEEFKAEIGQEEITVLFELKEEHPVCTCRENVTEILPLRK